MIKIIGMLSMLLDHIGQELLPGIDLLPILGRLALPMFSWEIAQGFKRTSNFPIYALRLLF
jgi:hypothetical protein